MYQRRITLITDYPRYIVENLGSFPKHVQPHGNACSSGAEYVRTRSEVTADLIDTCIGSKAKPCKIYQEKQLSSNDDQQHPRNRKQVENVVASIITAGQPRSSANLADEVQTLLSSLSDPA